VTWTTSDDTRARVDENGLVTIIGAGKSVITAKAGDKTAECEVEGIGPDVYCIGSADALTAQGWREDGLWKNGFKQNGYGQARFEAIHFSGDDLYVVGNTYNSLGMGDGWGHWKNGILRPYSGFMGAFGAGAMAVFNDDVYTGGCEYVPHPLGMNLPVAKVWKNGVKQENLESYNECPPYEVTSIALLNGDVYAVGTVLGSIVVTSWNEDGTPRGWGIGSYWVVWKNGKVELSDDHIELYGIFAANGNVYVAGSVCDPTPRPTLWVNNVPQRLPVPAGTEWFGGKAFRVFVSGSDVYVLGTYSDGQKGVYTVWKNNVRQDYPDRFIPLEIFVHGQDVYIIGVELDANGNGGPRKLWKNGAKQQTTFSVDSVWVK